MSEGFRKAFLGFNQSDVIEYIKKNHAEFSEKQDALNAEISELKSEISALNRKIKESEAELCAANEKLDEYKAREEEITRVSESIGKLYIVSQANARAVTQNAEENRRLAQRQVEENLAALKAAHEAIEGIIAGVTDTSAAFTENMSGLSEKLEQTQSAIEENNAASDRISAETRSVLSPAE